MYIYIISIYIFHFFVSSNVVYVNFLLVVNLPPTTHLNFFLFKSKSCFSNLLFAPTIKPTNSIAAVTL